MPFPSPGDLPDPGIEFMSPALAGGFFITKPPAKPLTEPLLLLLLSRYSHVQLCKTPEMAAHQAPLSMGFPRQEYWCGLPFPPLGDIPDPGIEPMSPALAGGFFTTEPPGSCCHYVNKFWQERAFCRRPFSALSLTLNTRHPPPPDLCCTHLALAHVSDRLITQYLA